MLRACDTNTSAQCGNHTAADGLKGDGTADISPCKRQSHFVLSQHDRARLKCEQNEALAGLRGTNPLARRAPEGQDAAMNRDLALCPPPLALSH